ncbi:unnamed protein product [Vitrella brassicaformis CCMP3155]|uniref:Uncharacterized protein n=1 Tax=Vitrella brassicaformis (strain CCMP3155) TaxID=1169540 RepID=A0A0G4H6I4_VITBC|nr:unnamed protein product [Vitrella brassicaformis CCMP3155]|eukprot:CEM39229.1 unnamed protein product [Vitrella brassicaformis CCMP3155]
MRQFGGQPPFVKLYAAEVDPQAPATYTNTRGDAIPALCIAMPLVKIGADKEHEFVELSNRKERLNVAVCLANKAREAVDPQLLRMVRQMVLESVSMLTNALLCTAKAHRLAIRRALCIDHFHHNVMLSKDALQSSSSELQQSDTAAGTVLLDLANTLAPTPPASLPSPPPPAYLGPHVVVLPLDKAAQAAQGQYPEGCTPWHVSPELWVAMKGPIDDEADEEAARAVGRINAGLKRTRQELRAEGLLVGEGKSEALMLEEPTIVTGIARAMSSVMSAEWQVETAIRDAEALGAAEEDEADKAAQELLLADLDHYTATIITQDGRPLDCRKDLLGEPICAAAKGLRRRQSERGTIADSEDQLVRALQLLELEQVRQATENGTSLQVPVALPPMSEKSLETTGHVAAAAAGGADDCGSDTASGEIGASPASYRAMPDSPESPAPAEPPVLPPPSPQPAEVPIDAYASRPEPPSNPEPPIPPPATRQKAVLLPDIKAAHTRHPHHTQPDTHTRPTPPHPSTRAPHLLSPPPAHPPMMYGSNIPADHVPYKWGHAKVVSYGGPAKEGWHYNPTPDEWEWWTRVGDGLWEVRAANLQRRYRARQGGVDMDGLFLRLMYELRRDRRQQRLLSIAAYVLYLDVSFIEDHAIFLRDEDLLSQIDRSLSTFYISEINILRHDAAAQRRPRRPS